MPRAEPSHADSSSPLQKSDAGGEDGAAPAKRKRGSAAAPAAAEEDDTAAMADIMMTRKTRKLYQSVQKNVAAKAARVEGLKSKAQRLSGKK